jgi:hypothetical protein
MGKKRKLLLKKNVKKLIMKKYKIKKFIRMEKK